MGSHNCTNLLPTEPYWDKKKILIVDAWFGGLRCCYVLLSLGSIRSILNVKANANRYSRKAIKKQAKDSGDMYAMTVKVEEEEMCAIVHVNKLPMHLVHTTESMLPGPK